MSQLAFMKLLENNSGAVAQSNGYIDLPSVVSHNKEWDCWIILDSLVYDITVYLQHHPGGKDAILEYAGKDATAAFNAVHPWMNFKVILEKLLVGRLGVNRGLDNRNCSEKRHQMNCISMIVRYSQVFWEWLKDVCRLLSLRRYR